ncbi:MAG: hypothetical protein HY363_05950 [Candidatus Aenigmarchaeota archaeon]|nr:hypothetical protein [Candidatus Aenigmarchaeota archaeon]
MLETSSKDYYAYGGPQQAHDLLGDYFWESFHKVRLHKKLNARLLFHSSLKWWAEKLNKLPHTQVKTTKKDFEEITETIICGQKVAIIIYTEKPYGLLIDEPHAAESYKKFFHLLWNSK